MNSNILLILRRKGIVALAGAFFFAIKGSVMRLFGRRFIQRRVHDFRMWLDLNDAGISRTLLLFGCREEEHAVILRRVLAPGMTVFDIGANIGYYVLIERGLVGPAGRIVGIEPSSQNVALLRRNLALNNAHKDVAVFEMAISDQSGKRDLYMSQQSNLNTFHPTGSAAGYLDGRRAEVEIDTVPGIARRTGLKPDLIRMDVEGHEVEVLRGLIPAIRSGEMAPMVLFETHLSRYAANHDMEQDLKDLFELEYHVKFAASTSSNGTARVESFGYRGEAPIETDLHERVVFENIRNEDAIELICRKGGIRAVLLAK
jgi:FkbM family methyltransferase